MKRSLLLPLILSGVALVSTAFAATDAEMKACFQAHSQLLSKPALRNLVTCWRVHGYLMQRR